MNRPPYLRCSDRRPSILPDLSGFSFNLNCDDIIDDDFTAEEIELALKNIEARVGSLWHN